MVTTFCCSSRVSNWELEVLFIESLIARMAARSRGTDGYSTSACVRKPTTTLPAESKAAMTLPVEPDTESRFALTISA